MAIYIWLYIYISYQCVYIYIYVTIKCQIKKTVTLSKIFFNFLVTLQFGVLCDLWFLWKHNRLSLFILGSRVMIWQFINKEENFIVWAIIPKQWNPRCLYSQSNQWQMFKWLQCESHTWFRWWSKTEKKKWPDQTLLAWSQKLTWSIIIKTETPRNNMAWWNNNRKKNHEYECEEYTHECRYA